jgi:hypothetical protein
MPVWTVKRHRLARVSMHDPQPRYEDALRSLDDQTVARLGKALEPYTKPGCLEEAVAEALRIAQDYSGSHVFLNERRRIRSRRQERDGS